MTLTHDLVSSRYPECYTATVSTRCPGQQVQQELLDRISPPLMPEMFELQIVAKWEITSANPITKSLPHGPHLPT